MSHYDLRETTAEPGYGRDLVDELNERKLERWGFAVAAPLLLVIGLGVGVWLGWMFWGNSCLG